MGGLSRCSNSFPSLPGNEQKMLKERDISVSLVEGGRGSFRNVIMSNVK